ncbi:MAG: glycosyltransferase family 39 protein [Fimbriimonas sp.]|nr:glycosyltransferase family 39 protein [Fimbriimonas sp.]
MLGVIVTALFTVGAVGLGRYLVGRWMDGFDPAEMVGVCGVIGLGTVGLATLFLGLIPGGLGWGVLVVWVGALFGISRLVQPFKEGAFRIAKPEGSSLLFALAVGVASLFALVGVLAPSDTLDWDTLAYHLAVPKLWIQAGQIQFIPTIHHSNFPATVDALYIWGLTWGGQSGAKAFSLMFLLLGLASIFGLSRRHYGPKAAWWAAFVFVTIPVVLWESGTGYIDVAHGLFGGLGILFAARYVAESKSRNELFLSAILLGFAAGSKYTGLQTIGVVAVILFAAHALRKEAVTGLKTAALVACIAMAIAGPWYVKNVVLTGNPVYPFFYEKFGGGNWDQRRADTYREEQQQFGAGTVEKRHDLTELGNAILGLAYQPGRYVNPQEDKGGGTPLGAIGVMAVAAGLIWALSGRMRQFEVAALSAVAFSILLWFFLSQQSRYVVPLSVPLALMAGGAIARLAIGPVLAGLALMQGAYSLFLVYTQRFEDQLQPVLGKVSTEDYESRTIGFYRPSLIINKEAAKGKVALYDEVFGYLLDVPYIWANPPHSMLIPYDRLNDAASYVDALKKLGVTHVYINLSPMVKDQQFVSRWVGAMGLNGVTEPFSPQERKEHWDNWKDKWEILLADAVAERRLEPIPDVKGHCILFRIL